MFMVIIAAALVLDNYFGNNPEELEKIHSESESQKHDNAQGNVYMISQTISGGFKILEEKAFSRSTKLQLHDKFLRSYHSIRNFQVLKAEIVQQTTPLISSYHYLVFQNHVFSSDEVPLG